MGRPILLGSLLLGFVLGGGGIVVSAAAGEAPYSPDLESAPRVKARVVRAGDGDTIDVRIGMRRERVRLIGIDTAELRDSDPKIQAWAKAAKAFTERELVGAEVELVADPLGDDRDKYGRLLRYVWLGSGRRNHNENLVREGYACVYRKFDFVLKREFLEIEKRARERRPEPDPCANRQRRSRNGNGSGSGSSGSR